MSCQLLCDYIFSQFHCQDALLGVAHRSSNIELISTFFQNICGFLDFSKVIVGSHVSLCKGKADLLCLAWLKKTGFCKSGKLAGWFLQKSLWSFEINLDNFFSSQVTGVGYLNLSENLILCFPHSDGVQAKGGVGKSISKWIDYFFLCPWKSFKIAVAYINIFRIVYIIKRLMEVGSGWIIIYVCGKSVSQLTGRISFAGEKLRHGKSAFHASLPSKKSGGNPVVIFYPGKIHDSADVENYHDIIEAFFYHGKHFFLTGSEIEVAIRENFAGNFRHGGFRIPWIKFVVAFNTGTVPAFTGKTADHNNSNVSKCFCTVSKFRGKLWLYCHSWCGTFFILVLDIGAVKCG